MRGMQPQDVYRIEQAAGPRLHPDGRTAAFVGMGVDEDGNSYVSSIYTVPVDGSAEPVRFTSSDKADSDPRYSPDGRLLAFTSNRAGDTSQLYVIPASGGEATRLTDFDESVEEIAWSPDSRSLAVVVRVRDRAYEEEDEKKREPRRITKLMYSLDNVGWTCDRPRHIFVVPADGTGEPTQITFGATEEGSIAWSPDGTRIAFVSSRTEDWDLDEIVDVYTVDPAGGEPERVTHGDGVCSMPSYSPDGTKIAYGYHQGVWDWPRHTQIAVMDLATRNSKVITSSLDLNCAPFPAIREPVWSGTDILFALESSGNTLLYRVAADGGSKPEPVIEGDLTITGFDAVGDTIVHSFSSPTELSEVYQGSTRLSQLSTGFFRSVEAIAPERFIANSSGDAEVECWIMRPSGFTQGQRYPVLLNVHGGPFTQYANRFFDEFQVYASAGYVVVYCNPRGSSGYSEEWGRAIMGPTRGGPGMGSVDFDDVMACIETALERFDFCDPDRVGIMGGSYGGFMTTWAISHSKMFKAAISERAVNNWVSFFGSSDMGPYFKGMIGSWPFEDMESHLRISPTTYAQSIETPLLIMHSENDLRCDVEQAGHLFNILRLQRKEVELVRFPAESHELTRSGSPFHRVRRFEIVLDWFDRHLK